MNRFLLAVAITLMTVAPSLAQCNAQPRLDQTNLNLGQVLSQSQNSVAMNCPNGQCNAPARAEAKATVQGAPAPAAQPDAAAFAAEVMRQMQAQGYVMNAPQGGYKPLRVGSSAYAHAEVNGYQEAAPMPTPVVVTPAPVTPLAFPVAFALPDNSAVAQASVNNANVAGCNGGCGRGGFFRRGNRTRTRATTVQNGQRTTTVAVASSR